MKVKKPPGSLSDFDSWPDILRLEPLPIHGPLVDEFLEGRHYFPFSSFPEAHGPASKALWKQL